MLLMPLMRSTPPFWMPGRSPRELGPRVHENIAKKTSIPFLQQGLDLDIGAQDAHFVGHDTSGCPHEDYQIIPGRVKRLRLATAKNTASASGGPRVSAEIRRSSRAVVQEVPTNKSESS